MTLNESNILNVQIKEEPDPIKEITNIKEEPNHSVKTSNEILTELFSAFNAEPPVITPTLPKSIKSEKHGKHKKKHKHKDKKRKKKSSKSERYSSNECSEDDIRKHKHKKSKISSNKYDENKRRHKNHEEEFINEVLKNKEFNNGNTNLVKEIHQASVSDDIKAKEINQLDNILMRSTITNKITIKNLKFSSTFETNVRIAEEQARMKAEQYEDGELSECNDHEMEDCTYINYDSRQNDRSKNESKSKSSHSEYHRNRHKSRYDPISKSRDRTSATSKDRRRSSSRDRHKKEKSASYKYRDHNISSRRHDVRKEKILTSSYKNHHRSKTRSRSRSRSRSRTRMSSSHLDIDKKRLLAIARKNAIHMLKSGTLPGTAGLCKQAQEKVMAAIKSGGKTIEELTDFCKNLSQNEEIGDLSSVSSGESDHEEDGSDKLFHHPFVIKDRGAIVMNIKNSVQIPTKTLQEKTAEQVKSLRMLFPVSSGTHHRKTENEWVPVSPSVTSGPVSIKPKKDNVYVQPNVDAEKKNVHNDVLEPQYAPLSANNISKTQSCLEPAAVPINNQVFTSEESNLDISTIISQRLLAMRRLQENPTDVNAMNDMYHAQRDMSVWASSKYEPGQFTGSTGANILSARELQSGTQAWAKRDQLQKAAPVSGGMGMHLLQKMGWRPGEGLGKDKSGSLQPLLLEVKLDKKGLVANEETPHRNGKQTAKKPAVYTLAGKHPVSLLGEYASKRKLGAPCYELCFESGPDHKKNFLFKVKLNGVEYQPSVASVNKKQAKADAATVCLQKLGVLPTTQSSG